VSRVTAAEATTTAPGSLAVDPLQREVLLEELAALTSSLRAPEVRATWDELAAAVDTGSVDLELSGRLETILEMVLQTGRTRRMHGAEAEQALLRLFHQTPQGSGARRALQAVDETLATLAGHSLEAMLLTLQGPGVFRLGVKTDRCSLTLEIDQHGVSVESLEV
jgi:hypothetical protein